MEELRNKDGLTEKEFLEKYKPGDYDRPSVTADMLLFTIDKTIKIKSKTNDEHELKVLLIKRNNHPFMNKWALPGGFVNIDESIDDAAYRELKEETNLANDVYLEQLYTFSTPNRDPRMRVISTAYMALTPFSNIKNTKAGDDASDAFWFTIKKTTLEDNDEMLVSMIEIIGSELDIHMKYKASYTYRTKKSTYEVMDDSKGEVAFDHIEIIDMGLMRLKNKVSYTDVAFNLLPEKFTLDDLQQVFEILLGEKLVKPNFRTKIEPMVIKTNEQKDDVGYRRPYLYMKNPKYI
jgi:ADP-ribose pyrophosphatase YjhB (NUDIX family)